MKFFVDNNLSPKVARALNCLVTPKHSVSHLKDRFLPDTSDVEWLDALAKEDGWIILSADTAISRNPHEVEAWKRAGHPIFFFKPKWVKMKLWDQASKLFKVFPDIIALAEHAQEGDQFEVPVRGKIDD